MIRILYIFEVIVLLMSLNSALFAQTQIVFTSSNNNTGETKFWQMNVDSPFDYNSISDHLDAIAPYSGEDHGPISVSKDGDFYAFLSSRFDETAQGWEALTIVKSDFSGYEVIHDHDGNLIHSEDKAFVLSGGNAIVFVADIGNHSNDIFIIRKNGSTWDTPVNLTQNSTYDFNYCPYVSNDGTKVLFDASNSSFPSTAIGQLNIDGGNINFPVTASSMANGVAAHSPSYNANGDIIFEGDDGTERIWKLPSGSTTPVIINSTFTNDNSPVVLPDGRIASLWLPGDWHQIKIMNDDGSEDYMITEVSTAFTEVFDIGMTAWSATTTVIDKIPASLASICPNPSNGNFVVNINTPLSNSKIEIYSLTGEKIYENNLNQTSNRINISEQTKGVYLLKFYTENKTFSEKIILQP